MEKFVFNAKKNARGSQSNMGCYVSFQIMGNEMRSLRADRVARLREEFLSGKYSVDSVRLADRLLKAGVLE